MLTLSEVKTWLRLEQDDTAEDVLLQALINAATEYIRNAVPSGMAFEANPLAQLLARVLVTDWYEHREAIGQVREEIRPTVRAIVLQLQTAYPVIETASLPDAIVGVAYTVVLVANGGAQPYKWSIASGSLPPGMALDEDSGEISGTPSAEGTFAFTVQVADSNLTPKIASRPLTITVVAAS